MDTIEKSRATKNDDNKILDMVQSKTTIYLSTENIVDNLSDSTTETEENIENDTMIHSVNELPIVDFVLVYKHSHSEHTFEKRAYFEDKLEDIGLIIATEKVDKLYFVKIHIPIDVLCRYCEIMKLRMPMKDIPNLNSDTPYTRNTWKKFTKIVTNFFDEKLGSSRTKRTYKWSAEFSTNRDYLFNIDSEHFFTPSVKSMVINFILERGKFGTKPEDVGIAKLLNDEIYKAAYPLHDGSTTTLGSDRKFFSTEWASFTKLLKYQPLDYMKDYFGAKFTLYFAWLGFYTLMLIPASIFGVLTMIYGGLTLSSDAFSNEVCDPNLNFTMCPKCDKYCDYWDLIKACDYSKVTHLFDNYGTIWFAFFMSVWSALYLEFWKRYSAEIKHRWGFTGFDLLAQHPRPQYLARLANARMKLNVITNQEEPVVPFCRVKLPTMVLSFSFAFIWVSLAIAAVFGVVIYRMTGIAVDILTKDRMNNFTSFVVPVTAGIINLICIVGLNFVYDRLALHLTQYEYQRTQIEFDDSLTLKIYMFQFVNYYSSVFYIALLKGKFVGYPMKYNRIFEFRQEECNLGGCMMELFMQLAIVMIGKQLMNAIVEFGIPMFKYLKSTNSLQKPKDDDSDTKPQWLKDYNLLAWDSRGMFSEYLEMVIQYGFVTIFVTAFPLAPLFALINNIFEMRLDAKKYAKYYRRPISQRVKGIGIWFQIIETIGKMSIISNALIIAFSSNFIPTMVYKTMYPELGEKGFLNFSLAYFDVEDFQEESLPLTTKYNVTQCRYSEYRSSKDLNYQRNLTYWHILVARLAFIIVFQNVVHFVVVVIQWAIPDIPKHLNDQIKQEALRTSEYIIEKESARAKEYRKSLY